ncbi:hypothetical protein N9L68_05185 [bacterium]|nr:hypothetical protein [bacterium]
MGESDTAPPPPQKATGSWRSQLPPADQHLQALEDKLLSSLFSPPSTLYPLFSLVFPRGAGTCPEKEDR